ncbi:hypothetical protein [Caulobacter segnis]
MSVLALSLMLMALPVGDRIPGLKPPVMPSYTQHPANDRLGVNFSELRLKAVGGYAGERLAMAKLKLYRRLGPSMLYADRHGHLYADRDGDGVIDAGALYNPKSHLVSADWNCDGRGDQILAHVKL